jgi:hypothetical protein
MDRLQTGDCRKPSGSCYVHRPLQDWRQRGVLVFIAVYQENLDYSSSSFLNSGACVSNISGNGKQTRDTSLRAMIEAVYSVPSRRRAADGRLHEADGNDTELVSSHICCDPTATSTLLLYPLLEPSDTKPRSHYK